MTTYDLDESTTPLIPLDDQIELQPTILADEYD